MRYAIALPAGALLAQLAGVLPAAAQLQPQLGVRGSLLPLYGGGGNAGTSTHWAGTVHGGAVLGAHGHGEVELFYTIGPRSDAAPRMQLAGLILAARGSPRADAAVIVGLGAGMLDIAQDDRVCGPPICLSEGGPVFEKARLATLIGVFGIDVPLGGTARLRLDGRGHVPLGGADAIANSGDIRLDIGAGVRLLPGGSGRTR